MKLKELSGLTKFADRHLPEIMGIGAAIGTVTTGALSYKAGKEIEKIEDPTAKDYVKILSKPLLSGAATLGCIYGLNYAHIRRYAALMTAYTLSQMDIKTYKEKVKEIFGDEQEREVEKRTSKEKKKMNPVYVEETHEQIICDLVTGRRFKKSPMNVLKAVQNTNSKVLREAKASVNDFYNYLEIEECEAGSMLGWKVDGGTDMLEIEWNSMLDDDMQPLLTIRYDVEYFHNWL